MAGQRWRARPICSPPSAGSPARSTTWISLEVARLDHRLPERLSGHRAGLPTLATTGISAAAPAFYPNLPASSAVTQLKNDLPTMAQAYYGGSSMSAQTIFQQRSLVNAFMEARANFGSGGGDTFAALHADVQAQNSYISAARQAMTWVPVLNLVLTIVFYAMFPVVFPLFLFPQTGPALLKGYLTGFFYLASWGPIYAVLHMFITQYSAAQLSALAPTGMTMATMAGIDSVNQNMETLAGYLLMFVPVMAAGMAKGAMSIASNTTAMLAPAMHAAEAAAVERTTGNYAYGNSQFQNVTGHQVNTAPTWNVAASPIPQVNMRGDNGTITSTMADGSTVYNTSGAISRFGFSASEMQSVTGNLQQTGAQSHARQCRAGNLGRALEPWDAHPRQPLFGHAPCERERRGDRRPGRQHHHLVRPAGHRFQAADRHQPDDRRDLTSGRSLGQPRPTPSGSMPASRPASAARCWAPRLGFAGGTWDHQWTKTTGDQEAHGTSDLSQSQGSKRCPLPCQRAGHHAHRWRLLARWHLPPRREFRRKAPRHRARLFLRRNRSNGRLPALTRSARASNAWPRSRAATATRSPTT
jgi:conjugal transfer mating pair stabilization protein TraG